MGNFSFLKADWPLIHEACVRAEAYMAIDPLTACFHSRRGVDLLIKELYGLLQIPEPFDKSLASKLNNQAFRRGTGAGEVIVNKLNYLRKAGNTAAHEGRRVPREQSLRALNELFHVMVWAAFKFGTSPKDVPQGKRFDEQLAQRTAPVVSRAQARAEIDRFIEQDEARERQLAESEAARAEMAQQLEQLRTELAHVKAQQAAGAQPTELHHDMREAETRANMIDLDLHQAGWALDQTRDREYPVTGMPTPSGKGAVDYVLWGNDGMPLGLVEAKRSSRSAHDGEEQARQYADCLEAMHGRRPVIFCTNGDDIWLWDDAAGYPPRRVQGYYTANELTLAIRRRDGREALERAPINTDIAGRPYQVRAIRAIDQAFDSKRRRALLVMATGSGKTRVVIALADQLAKAGWAKRILFLADREALVSQATKAFNEHLPNSPVVNLLTDKTTEARIYVSTHQTMLGLINTPDENTQRFGPGFFDLVVIDEAHRSVYARYGAIFDYFDALLVGLTATPKADIAHDTYSLFGLDAGVPTDAYRLDEAVADGYLVPANAVSIHSKVMTRGTHYSDLSADEQEHWDNLEWGDTGPLDDVEAGEVNRYFFNANTVDQVIAELMEHGRTVSGGDRIAKTIIFARNQAHAHFIKERFDIAWPQLGGDFAQVITSSVTGHDGLIKKFIVPDSRPHIAISVDMLDTGIDVPEVANLVFFKQVHSKTKFWQMLGRGTRLCPDLYGPGDDKQDFFVFDFCGNLEYFSHDLPEVAGSLTPSLTQRRFTGQLNLLAALDARPALSDEERELRTTTADALHHFVAAMSTDNVLVRPHRALVGRFAQADAWNHIDEATVAEGEVLAGLPSAVAPEDESAKRFDLMMQQAQLAVLTTDEDVLTPISSKVRAIADNLATKTTIPAVKGQLESLEQIADESWWVDVTVGMLETMRVRLRLLTRYLDTARRNAVFADITDTFTRMSSPALPGGASGVDLTEFRHHTEAFLAAHADNMALQRLRRNRPLTSQDLKVLEQLLAESGADPEALSAAISQAGGLGRLIRSLVGLDPEAVQQAFAAFLDERTYSVDQIRYVGTIIHELTANGVMPPTRLFEPPYTDTAPKGPEYFFPQDKAQVIVQIVEQVNSNAEPPTPVTA